MLIETTVQKAMNRLTEFAQKTFSDRVVFRVEASDGFWVIVKLVERDGDDRVLSQRYLAEVVNELPPDVLVGGLHQMARELGRYAFTRQ